MINIFDWCKLFLQWEEALLYMPVAEVLNTIIQLSFLVIWAHLSKCRLTMQNVIKMFYLPGTAQNQGHILSVLDFCEVSCSLL